MTTTIERPGTRSRPAGPVPKLGGGPERVVTAGPTDRDAMLALGAAPVGVRRPESQPAEGPQGIGRELGQESVSEADAIFPMVGGGGEDEKAAHDALERLHPNPPWGRLRAVKNDRVHEVDPNAWFITPGPQAANVVLDAPEEHLLEGDR